MPPNLDQASGRLYFRSVQARELTSISEDLTQKGSIKIVQDGDNTALQAVKPDGSLGAKLVIGAEQVYLEAPTPGSTGGGGAGATTSRVGFTSSGLVGLSGEVTELAGIETVPTNVSSTVFKGLVADNSVSTYRTPDTVVPKHTILSSTTRDLVLAGNGVVSSKYTDSPACHVITLGALHAYEGNGQSSEGGDAVKVMGRRLIPGPFATYEPASVNLGIHHNPAFGLTGSSTTRGKVSSTSNTDLSIESGNQLRMRGADVVIGSHATVKFYPNKAAFATPAQETNNPHGYLEIAHQYGDQASAVTLSTPAVADPVGIIVKPATGNFGAEADTLELGSGDVRYKFCIQDGQLRIKKLVISSGQPEKTICVFDG
eukprot:jgi/Mesvir1/21660/Mv04081-RA.1